MVNYIQYVVQHTFSMLFYIHIVSNRVRHHFIYVSIGIKTTKKLWPHLLFYLLHLYIKITKNSFIINDNRRSSDSLIRSFQRDVKKIS